MKTQKGFNLIEIVVVVGLVAIIAAIAVNSYQSHIRKSYRAEAKQTLLSMMLSEERFRSRNITYGNLTDIIGSQITTASGRYTLSVLNNTATSYTLRATATGNQANDKQDSTTCSPLEIVVNGATETKTPATCWTR